MGDLLATAQLCREVRGQVFSAATRNDSVVRPGTTESLKRLTESLDELTDGLTSSQSNKVLAREEYQIPLRDGLTQIRRDVESVAQLITRHYSRQTSKKTLIWYHVSIRVRREIGEAIDRLSVDSAKLQRLLQLVYYADIQEISSSIEALRIPISFGADKEIRQWLVGSENENLHTALVSTPDEQTVSWILEDPAYQEWRNSPNSLLGSGESVRRPMHKSFTMTNDRNSRIWEERAQVISLSSPPGRQVQ